MLPIHTEVHNRSEFFFVHFNKLILKVVSQSWHHSAADIQQTVTEAVHQHIGRHKIYDDITLLVLKQK